MAPCKVQLNTRVCGGVCVWVCICVSMVLDEYVSVCGGVCVHVCFSSSNTNITPHLRIIKHQQTYPALC